jgi:adenylate kinase family enzyme
MVDAVGRHTRSGPLAVLLTGVFGVGKSTLAADLADRLDEAGVPVAALDLDWLTWTNVSGAGRAGEHDMMIANLRPMVDRYRAAGARYFVLARTIRGFDELATLGEALAMPLRVVELTIPFEEIARRLATDPSEARQRDLAETERWLSEHSSNIADVVVVNDRSVRELAVEILDWLGWPKAGW